VRIKGNVSVCVPNNISLMTPYILLEQEDWFEDEISFVRSVLDPGDRVIDIGANYGIYTLSAAAVVGAHGKVWAFEPCTETAGFLRQSVGRNAFGNVEVMTTALSDRQGSSYLSLSPNSELNALTNDRNPEGSYEEIHTETVDQCMSRYGWSDIAFVKLDAEGHEERILKGAANFLAAASPLVMYEIKAGEQVNLDLVNAFRAMGYDSYRLVPGPGALVPFDATQNIDPYQLNLFACKRDRAEMLARKELLVTAYEPVGVPTDSFLNKSWIEPKEWQDKLRLSWIAAWPALQGTESGKTYLQALECYAATRDESRPLSQRIGYLAQACDLLRVVAQGPDHNFSRLLSFAQAAVDWGHRSLAVNAYRQLLVAIQGHVSMDEREPFLPPQAPGLMHPIADHPAAWVVAGIAEQFERLSEYSSYFSGAGHQSLLENFGSLGHLSAEMERRRQLVRMRGGFSNGPEPNSVLAISSEFNLNCELWAGANKPREQG
jgi:FkbM family methyltransferase